MRTANPCRTQANQRAAADTAMAAVLANPGKSDYAIAYEMGINRKTVRKARMAAGIPVYINGQETVATAKAALIANPEKSNRELAEELGIDRKTVRKVRKDAGISPSRGPTARDRAIEAIAADPTRTNISIARELKIDPDTVRFARSTNARPKQPPPKPKADRAASRSAAMDALLATYKRLGIERSGPLIVKLRPQTPNRFVKVKLQRCTP